MTLSERNSEIKPQRFHVLVNEPVVMSSALVFGLKDIQTSCF